MARLRHLIVVLPGIGGSVLTRNGEVLWDGTLSGAVSRMIDPEPLHGNVDGIEAVATIRTASVTPFWTPIHGYDGLLTNLVRLFEGHTLVDTGDPNKPDLLADVVAMPYDFRQDIGHVSSAVGDRIGDRIKARKKVGKSPRIIVVAHSLGGLVARHWLATDDEAAGLCDAVVTLGTPFYGAPRALDLMVNGLNVLHRRWRRATEVLRSWPSFYDLLPHYEVVDCASGKKRPADIALPGVDSHLARKADERFTTLIEAWTSGPASKIDVIPFIGVGQPTFQSARWDGSTLVLSRTTPDWLAESPHTGDGTVPEKAAVPPGSRAPQWRSVVSRHGWLQGRDDVSQTLRAVTDPETIPTRGLVGEPTARLGLDGPELALAGEATALDLTIADSIDRHRTSVAAELRPMDLRLPRQTLVCGRKDGCWQATVPPLLPGLYEITATMLVDGREVAHVRELLGVVSAEAVSE